MQIETSFVIDNYHIDLEVSARLYSDEVGTLLRDVTFCNVFHVKIKIGDNWYTIDTTSDIDAALIELVKQRYNDNPCAQMRLLNEFLEAQTP